MFSVGFLLGLSGAFLAGFRKVAQEDVEKSHRTCWLVTAQPQEGPTGIWREASNFCSVPPAPSTDKT